MSIVSRLLRRVQLITVLGRVLLSLGLSKRVSARVGGRKEKGNTLKAARRSMAMAEEKVAVRARHKGSRQETTQFYPRCEWRCATPSGNSSPRLLILVPPTPPENAWDATSAPFRGYRVSSDQDALSVARTRVARKGHGGWVIPMALSLSFHGHSSSCRQYKTAPPPTRRNTLTPPWASEWLRVITRSRIAP